jgi:hypothetical protein
MTGAKFSAAEKRAPARHVVTKQADIHSFRIVASPVTRSRAVRQHLILLIGRSREGNLTGFRESAALTGVAELDTTSQAATALSGSDCTGMPAAGQYLTRQRFPK